MMNKNQVDNLNEEEIKKLIQEASDPKIERMKRNSKSFKRASAKVKKNADHILVEYLTQNYTIRWKACKIVAGNIIVVENKVHIVNPRLVWRDGKEVVYIVREIDRLPISNVDYDKLIKQNRITINDAVIIKAIVGAIQKQAISEQAKKWIIWVVVLVIAAFLGYIFFLKK